MNKLRSTLVMLLLVASLLLPAAGPLPGIASAAPAAVPAGADAVRYWSGLAVTNTVDVLPRFSPIHSFITLSYVQAAVYNAVVAIDGGFQPYHSALGAQPGASLEAAVARATLDVLLYYLPASKHAALAAEYDTYVAGIPAGPAKEAGLQLGQAAAAEIIALRQGDGWQANVLYSQPLGAGVFQPPAGTTALTPWVGQMQPFLINSASQFRPGPPPSLGSAKWARAYNELLAVGRLDSATRTPAQTEVARFWTDHPTWQYNTAYAEVSAARALSAAETARLMVMGNMVAADAGIACWDAKYTYNFWRPEPAINPALNGGLGDSHPGTAPDPAWKPLLGTPPHPEYPSGHGCVTSSQVELFTRLLGSPAIKLAIKSRTVPGQSVTEYTFATAGDLRQQIIDARVWSGIHFRFSDEIGVALGGKVARYGLPRYFQPAP
jgi:hypothetical protein